MFKMGFGKYLKKDVHRRVICGLTCSIILFSHYKVNGVKNYCNVNMITPIQRRKCSWKIWQNNFQWFRILKGLENTKCIDTTDKHTTILELLLSSLSCTIFCTTFALQRLEVSIEFLAIVGIRSCWRALTIFH